MLLTPGKAFLIGQNTTIEQVRAGGITKNIIREAFALLHYNNPCHTMYHLAHLHNKKLNLGLPTSSLCFDRHATKEMKNAVDMAGDYHKFILDKHFSHDITVCFHTEYFAAIKRSGIDINYSIQLIPYISANKVHEDALPMNSYSPEDAYRFSLDLIATMNSYSPDDVYQFCKEILRNPCKKEYEK